MMIDGLERAVAIDDGKPKAPVPQFENGGNAELAGPTTASNEAVVVVGPDDEI